ncbi:hypothetical protein KZ483_09755 [Paenibacillus sp. sptzw28]|uniref:hypothetical protein n=1 Tax=Paenibacillus sp. sptzw28 TaxID=715179 RepID=UPI001C6F0702|nr:hypothetical protein [Paenibacillus sp. sptzw28]QYR23172.1 hypothetical protein KZ483_09755 [Paenibacillus sp. sptzw28]
MQDLILVSAPNIRGEDFIRQLKDKRIPFAVITRNKAEHERIMTLGVERIIAVNTTKEITWAVPEFRIGKVYLFESSLNLCCRYIQICRSWTTKPIYVITDSCNPRLVYKGLGANYVIHTSSNDISFLITDDLLSDA